MMALRGEHGADEGFGITSEYGRPSENNTCRLVLSELSAEPGAEASQDIAWRAGEILLREFEVDRQLGAGGFGSVTLVKSALTDRRYAMKTIKPELVARPRSRRAFGVELAMWIDLGAHPHVVRAYFVRQIGVATAVFMEYVAGGTLAEWIERGLVLEVETIARIAEQIAAGLDAAHARGLVHADVKPENVLMGPDGAKVSDFGLAVAAGSSTGGMTIAYRSPEQAAGGSLTVATDVWSFGLTVLSMFAGGPFWIDGQVADAALQDFIDEPHPDRPPLPALARAALRRCFAPRPEDRWPSVSAAVCAMIGSASAQAPAARAPTAAVEQTEGERPIERWLLLAFELAGRDPSEARAHFPLRRASREAQALADLDAFEVAAPLLEQHAVPERIAEFHGHWGAALVHIGDFIAAREHAEKCVAALRRVEAPDPFALADALRHMAFMALQCRHYQDAESRLLEAREVLFAAGESGEALSPERARTLLSAIGQTFTDIAQMARLTLRFDMALAWAEDAVRSCAGAISAGSADASQLYDLAMAHAEKATALKWMNQSTASVKSFRASFDLFVKSGNPGTASHLHVVCSNALRDLGRVDEAMAEVQAAIHELAANSQDSGALIMAYHARADLLVRRDDWQGALPDFERERRHFERLVYDRGQRGMYRMFAQAELYHANALERVGRFKEALATIEQTISFLERLRRAGDWGPLNRELSDAHKLASACELSYVLNGLRVHGRFPATRVRAGAAHASASAGYAGAHHREQPNPETLLEVARLARAAAGLFDSVGERDEARVHRARARHALDALPGGPTAEIASLRRELTESERDADLSFALIALLKGDGEGAVAYASRWSDAWVSKCIQFTASSFLLYEEPLKAAEAFGGIEAMKLLVQSNCVERYFLCGVGALLRRNQDTAIASFRAAAELAPNDPFVLFGLAYVCSLCGAPQSESSAARARFAEHASLHPLLRAAETELGWSLDVAGA